MRLHAVLPCLALVTGAAACQPDASDVLGVEWVVDRVDFDTVPYTRGSASKTFTVANRGEASLYIDTTGFGEALDRVLHVGIGAKAVLLPGEVREFDVLLDPIRDATWPSGIQTATLTVTAARPVDGHSFSGDAAVNRATVPDKWVTATHDVEVVFTVLCDLDADGDDARACGGGDCQDDNKLVHSAQAETCDGVDQNCDGLVDNDASDQRSYYTDADLDGYGDRDLTPVLRCRGGDGWAQNADDCDDATPLRGPTRGEQCGNALDDDCDDEVDEGCTVDTDEPPEDTDPPEDPLTLDLDFDGLLGAEELDLGTDPEDPDTDKDGLFDGEEVREHGTSPILADTDADGLTDREELRTHFTSPLLADTDGDSLDDGDELTVFDTSPRRADTDDDGADDGIELAVGTDPLVEDSDGDGLDDGEEIALGLDPLEVDTDGDLLDDFMEHRTIGSDPTRMDTDGDNLDDGFEYGTSQTSPILADTDGDGLDDDVELDDTATLPRVADTDGDGLSDGEEVITWLSNPKDTDTDNDTLIDGDEVNLHDTDPRLPDTDGDGLDDAEELEVTFTDPRDADPDDDALNDADEVSAGTDPFVADTDGDTLLDGAEVEVWRTSPLAWDTDRDRLSDAQEAGSDTSPQDPDTDRDGLNDGDERFAGLDPTSPDVVVPTELASLPVGTLRVTELHLGAPSCADGMPTWIELANPTATWIDLAGARVASVAVSPTSLSRPNDPDFLLAPGEHVIVAEANAACPDTWRPNYTWSGALLVASDRAQLTFAGTPYVTLDYRGWVLPTDATLSLDPAGDPATAADWCEGIDAIDGSDTLGSPGLSNPDCP